MSLVKQEEVCIHFKNAKKHDDLHVQTLEVLYESSHYDYRIYRCKECGQIYLYEFYEYVNFNGGNDSIYCTYVPVSSVENAKELFDQHEKRIIHIRSLRPAIHSDTDSNPKYMAK